MSRQVAAAKFLGTYDGGIRWVDVYVRSGRDAEFSLQPGSSGRSRITIGLDYRCFWEVLHITLHEITELIYTEMWLRYAPAPDISKENGNYHFSMDHTQFSEATARVALFMTHALPDVQKEWRRYVKASHRR